MLAWRTGTFTCVVVVGLPGEEGGEDAERAAGAQQGDVRLGCFQLGGRRGEIGHAEEEEGEVQGEE